MLRREGVRYLGTLAVLRHYKCGGNGMALKEAFDLARLSNCYLTMDPRGPILPDLPISVK